MAVLSPPVRTAFVPTKSHVIDAFKATAHTEKLHSANDEGDLTEAECDALAESLRLAGDRGGQQRKDADCKVFGRISADKAQSEELRRMPGMGYLA